MLPILVIHTKLIDFASCSFFASSPPSCVNSLTAVSALQCVSGGLLMEEFHCSCPAGRKSSQVHSQKCLSSSCSQSCGKDMFYGQLSYSSLTVTYMHSVPYVKSDQSLQQSKDAQEHHCFSLWQMARFVYLVLSVISLCFFFNKTNKIAGQHGKEVM